MSQTPSKRISQAQIAKEIGCSQALVSMALNGHTKGVSQKTYNQIRELAAEQGYKPKGMKIEASVDQLRQRTIGYILRSPLKLANKSNFFSHVHQGLHEHLQEHRIKTVYLGSEDDLTESKAPLSSHISDSVRGIAIMGEVAPSLLSKIRALDRPIVYVSARASGQCHSVLSNELESAEMLVDHLYELGHRSFAWLGGGKPIGRHDDRLSALEQALAAKGLSLEARLKTRFEGADRKEGYEAAAAIFKQSKSPKSRPTAWLCLNGLMGRGAINFLLQQQIKVGVDISVAAFDMTRVCEEERPTLTSASADPEEMGRQAGRILTEALESESIASTDITLPARFVKRESTGPAPKVAKAKPARSRAAT